MKFAVIGHPVAHSLSPKMHSANFAAIGFDGTYEKFDVAPEDVERFVREKRHVRRLRGSSFLWKRIGALSPIVPGVTWHAAHRFPTTCRAG